MGETAGTIPHPPAARIFVSSVSALMGFHPKRTTNDVLKEVRRQRTDEPATNKMINTELYWTLVGMIKDTFEEPKRNHLDTIRAFVKEDHPDSWYEKLYDSMRVSMSRIDKPQTIECPLTRDKRIVLCGKPDIIDGNTVIDVKKTTKFSETLKDDDKIRLYCYMKICKRKRSILREVNGTETNDILLEWDTLYWKKIHKLILAFCDLV